MLLKYKGLTGRQSIREDKEFSQDLINASMPCRGMQVPHGNVGCRCNAEWQQRTQQFCVQYCRLWPGQPITHHASISHNSATITVPIEICSGLILAKARTTENECRKADEKASKERRLAAQNIDSEVKLNGSYGGDGVPVGN